MAELENWIAEARAEGAARWSSDATDRLAVRIADQPTPTALSRRNERRIVLGCAAAAALIGFVTTGALEYRADRASPRWPAATQVEPSVLLVADNR